MCDNLRFQIWSACAYSKEVCIDWMMSVSPMSLDSNFYTCLVPSVVHTSKQGWPWQRAILTCMENTLTTFKASWPSTSSKKLRSIIILQPDTESNKISTYLFLKHERISMPFIYYFPGRTWMKTSHNSTVTSLFERESHGLSLAIEGQKV
jgi:hypothetical protein